jgi:hypothetical protein
MLEVQYYNCKKLYGTENALYGIANSQQPAQGN